MSTHRICALADLADSRPHLIHVDGEDIVLVRKGEEVFALSDVCTHADISLSTGDVVGDEIECWLHGSRFDLRTGQPSGPPAWQPVHTFPTAVDADGAVTVSVA